MLIVKIVFDAVLALALIFVLLLFIREAISLWKEINK